MSERQALLLAGDVVCVIMAVLVSWAAWIWRDTAFADPVGFLRSKDALTPFLLLGPLWFFLIFHLYDPHVAFNRERTISGLALATGIALIPYLGLYFFAAIGTLPRFVILVLPAKGLRVAADAAARAQRGIISKGVRDRSAPRRA